MSRRWSYYALKVCSVLCLLAVTNLSVFACDPLEAPNRASISIMLFLTAIAFHFAIGGDMPKVPYLTRLDYYLLFTYLYLALGPACTMITVLLLVRLPSLRAAQMSDLWAAVASGLVIVFFNVIWALWNYITRRMNRHKPPTV